MSTTEERAVARLGLEQGRLAGKVAVVTGGGRGIGREIALAFAWLGAGVVIAELSAAGQETERLVRQAGGQALCVRTDVSSAADVARLAARALEAFGPADYLINNAIAIPVAPLVEMEVADWERVMAVNLNGAFLTCKAFLPAMLERGSGVVINMVSAEAMPGLSAYIASKQGLVGLSQSLAAEVGSRGVQVVAFAPGMVDTPGIRGSADKLAPLLGMSVEQFLGASLHPAYAGMMPAEHAGAATAYLAAELAGEYHGEVVTGYEVLERAGLIQAASAPSLPSDAAPAAAAIQGERLRQTMELSRRLESALAQTAAEFEKLPVFVRPMARSGFKGKAGQSIQDWVRHSAHLTQLLEKAAGGEAGAAAQLQGEARLLKERLGKLSLYYQGVPAETARFTKDAGLLQEVARLTGERVALISALAEARVRPKTGRS